MVEWFGVTSRVIVNRQPLLPVAREKRKNSAAHTWQKNWDRTCLLREGQQKPLFTFSTDTTTSVVHRILLSQKQRTEKTRIFPATLCCEKPEGSAELLLFAVRSPKRVWSCYSLLWKPKASVELLLFAVKSPKGVWSCYSLL